MAKFRLLAGIHVMQGRVYGKDEIICTSELLDEMFKNKFEKVHDSTPIAKAIVSNIAPPAAKAPVVDAPQVDEDDAGEVAPPDGDDVTADFQQAVDQDFKVFRRKEGRKSLYYVYDADDLSKPLNDKGVKKGEVDGVIEEALED